MASPWAPGGPPAHDLHPRLSSDSTPPSHSSHSSPAAPFPSALRVRRKPLPQHVDPVIPGTDQLSTPPLSVDQDTPTSLPTSNALPFARSPSPSTDGDSFISLPRNSIRYAHQRASLCFPCPRYPLPFFSRAEPVIDHDMVHTCFTVCRGAGKLTDCPSRLGIDTLEEEFPRNLFASTLPLPPF